MTDRPTCPKCGHTYCLPIYHDCKHGTHRYWCIKCGYRWREWPPFESGVKATSTAFRMALAAIMKDTPGAVPKI